MRYTLLLLFIYCFIFVPSPAQPVLGNEELMTGIKEGVYKVYNYEFEKAEVIFKKLKSDYPDHPVGYLLFSLLQYYKYYPLIPGHEMTPAFITEIEKSIQLSERILEKNKNDLEGIAFSMVSRSLLSMYYADNELSMKVISNAPTLYNLVVKGFKLKDEFVEFYFTTGLYNYYRVAYPEAHPVYKPVTVFFQPGNKELGLQQLRYAVENAVFMKAEAMIFLTYIYLNFENKPDSAMHYARKLYEEYPENQYFLSEYTEVLLINKEFEKAKLLIIDLLSDDNQFNQMKGVIFKGIYEEIRLKDLNTAKRNYLSGLKIAETYGPMANNFKAYSYLGLARIYKKQGNEKKAREHEKAGNSFAKYDYHYSLAE
ncbi:MAG: tetratricopeptide repeat protein [Bacteroidota bacterium]